MTFSTCYFILQHVAEILILELCLVLHTSLVTVLLVRRTISFISMSVGKEHVRYNTLVFFKKGRYKIYQVEPNDKTTWSNILLAGRLLLYDSLAPRMPLRQMDRRNFPSSTPCCQEHILAIEFLFSNKETYKTIALAIDRWVYPAIFELIVTNDTANPTDCELTSQKLTNLPHVFDRGRYARHAAETVQRVFATVAVISLDLGTFSVMVPPISSAMIWTASPTDLSSVVLVVEKPISRIMTVEKELTTPFGIALEITSVNATWNKGREHVRSKYRCKQEEGFGVHKGHTSLGLVEFLILDTHFVTGYTLHSDETLTMIQEAGVRGRIW